MALLTFVYTEILYQPNLPSDEAELVELHKEGSAKIFVNTLKLNRITVNLSARRNRLRFLDIKMFLVPFKGSMLSKLEESKHLIYDSIIDVSTKMDAYELNSVAGKILLEDRIKKRINSRLRAKLIKEIYFTKYTIQ